MDIKLNKRKTSWCFLLLESKSSSKLLNFEELFIYWFLIFARVVLRSISDKSIPNARSIIHKIRECKETNCIRVFILFNRRCKNIVHMIRAAVKYVFPIETDMIQFCFFI